MPLLVALVQKKKNQRLLKKILQRKYYLIFFFYLKNSSLSPNFICNCLENFVVISELNLFIKVHICKVF